MSLLCLQSPSGASPLSPEIRHCVLITWISEYGTYTSEIANTRTCRLLKSRTRGESFLLSEWLEQKQLELCCSRMFWYKQWRLQPGSVQEAKEAQVVVGEALRHFSNCGRKQQKQCLLIDSSCSILYEQLSVSIHLIIQ